MSKVVLEIKDVWRTFNGIHALRGASLVVRRGDFMAVVGRSGSGKSTLLHIMGLMDSPTRGRVRLLGKDVSRLTEEEKTSRRAENLGFVFQTPNLLPELDSSENVAIAGQLVGMPRQKALEKADALLKKIGLGHRLRHDVTKLSAGEKQRVAVARAVFNDPVLLLADEPTGNLDTRTRDEIIGLFSELNKEGRTIVIVTHDPGVAGQAKKVVELRDGRIR